MAIEPKITEFPMTPRQLFSDAVIEKQSFILDNEGNIFIGFDAFDKPMFVEPEELNDFEIESAVFLSTQDRMEFVSQLTHEQRVHFETCVFVTTTRDMLSTSFKVTDLIHDDLKAVGRVTRQAKAVQNRPLVELRIARQTSFMLSQPIGTFKDKLRSIQMDKWRARRSLQALTA